MKMQTGIRLATGCSIASLLCGALGAAAVSAQDNEIDQVPTEVGGTAEDAIVVTGTRLSRDPNEVAPSPVQSITIEEIRGTGVVDVSEALREIPALSNSGTIADSLERGAGGVGQAVLDLRGLGAARTLVLVNGRRHVSGVAGSQAVDVSTIPDALIRQVEVLSGGASAVYGADAVTGVVNYILRDDFDGLELNGQTGVSKYGDGFTASIEGVIGKNFADGRGNVALSGSYSRIDEIQQGDRPYTRANARFNSGQTYPNPLLRFQQGDITAGGTPNFFDFYSVDNGRYPFGFNIPLPGTAAYDAVFGGATPTAAEQALIDQAQGSPALAFQPFPVFAISSNSGLIFRNDFGFFNADINNNGVNDCEESFIGFTGFGGGGCYVSTPDGGVRIFQDGIVASSTNQFGGDGAPERLSAQSLIPQNDRYNANLIASFEFSPAVEVFAEAKYVRTETQSQNPYNTFYDSLLIFPDNPYIPDVLQDDADEAGGLRVSRDFTDLGAGFSNADRDTYRIVAGVRGDLSETIRYEVYGNYGRTDSRVTNQNSVLYDRLFAALDAVDEGQFLTGTPNGNVVCRSDLDPTAVYPGSEIFPVIEGGFFTFNPGDGQCAPISIFNGENSVSQAGVDFITTPTTTNSRIQQFVANAALIGDTSAFFELPGGPVAFVIGAEYRDERSRTRLDPLEKGILPVDTPFGNAGDFIGDISGNQQLTFDASTRVFDSGGSYDVREVFGEIRLPILADLPFAKELELSGAARYSDYSNIGGSFTWNVNGIYAPIEDIRFRATYAKAVRAPNIFELFSPQQGTVFRPADPCSLPVLQQKLQDDPEIGALRQANCYAELGPLGFDFDTNPYIDPLTARFPGTSGGNPDLDEETAKTWTAGAVIQPRFIPGLTITGDYYDLKIDNGINAVSSQNIVDSCYDNSTFPNQFCDLFDRQTTANSATIGGLAFLRQTQINFGKLETAGVDATIRYGFDLGELDIGLRAQGNWVEKLNFFFDPTDPSNFNPALGETGNPEWQANGAVSLGYGPLTIGYRLQWIDSQGLAGTDITRTGTTLAGPAGFIDDVFIHDASFDLEVNDQFNLYGGVNNFTNVEPYPTNSAYPVSPYGRYFFLGVRVRTGLF